MFKNLFGKKNTKPGVDEWSEAVDRSTLKMLNHQLFMHYYDKNTSPDPQNPAWQNQGIFFWTAKEPFERKSLPPDFKDLEIRHFIVNEIPDTISVSKGTAMPWFGMPGGGDKYYFTSGEKQIPISNLIDSNALSYVQIIELNNQNPDILTDRENYYLLLDSETVRYEPSTDKFYFLDNETTLGGAFKNGGVKVVKLI